MLKVKGSFLLDFMPGAWASRAETLEERRGRKARELLGAWLAVPAGGHGRELLGAWLAVPAHGRGRELLGAWLAVPACGRGSDRRPAP